jgi:hypothetical protein
MNTHTTIRPSAIDRELGEIEALEDALNSRAAFLRKARFWQRQHKVDGLDSTKLRYALNLDEADRYMPDILMAAYKLLEIDALHAAAIEAGAEG